MRSLLRVEKRLRLQACGDYRRGRRRSLASITYAANQSYRHNLERWALQDLESAARLWSEANDLRDARRMLARAAAAPTGTCIECNHWPHHGHGHEPDCALERITR